MTPGRRRICCAPPGFCRPRPSWAQEVTIRTIIGRELTGTLKTELPSYSHSFGTTVPELLTIGTEAEQ